MHVCEHDEPFIARAGLEFAGGFSATYGACWVFAADTDAEKEAIGDEGGEEAVDAVVGAVGCGSEDREQNHDERGDEETPFAAEVVGCVAEDEHTNDCAGKGDGGDVGLGVGIGVSGLVDGLEHGVDGADHLVGIMSISG